VTIEHVLTHRAGIPVGPGGLRWDRPADAETTARAMEELTPRWLLGEGVGYHPVNYGWMIREIVRRVAGKPIGRFLRDEILEPLGIRDVYLGLPPELEERVAHHYLMPGYTPQEGGLAGDVVEEAGIRTVAALNRPETHQAEVPAAGIIATAREVARFYVMLLAGGELEGVRVLRRESVEKATSLAVEANPDLTLGVPVRWAYGFHLGATTPTPFGRAAHLRAFGHSGASCTVAWADPETDLALAYLTNGERDFPSNLQRFMDMADAVRRACR
jgi:CubicO group peptidase (beta-lactamase class C family)